MTIISMHHLEDKFSGRVLRGSGLCANTGIKTTPVSIQNSIINHAAIMPSNRTKIDADIVRKTQYNVPLN